MGKSLFIAEKPSVAREFANALKINTVSRDGYIEGNNTIITWCVGHLVAGLACGAGGLAAGACAGVGTCHNVNKCLKFSARYGLYLIFASFKQSNIQKSYFLLYTIGIFSFVQNQISFYQ